MLVALFLTGLPVAFVFFALNFAGLYILLPQFSTFSIPIFSGLDAAYSFAMVPVPLFILMGEVLHYTALANIAINSIDKWIGRVPARLSFITIITGAIFGALSGSGVAMTALFGSLMVPEMRSKGYSKEMCMGPVMAAGTLSLVIPPTIFAIVLGSVAKVSIGALLIACIIPGILISALFALYVVYRGVRDPQSAPSYDLKVPLQEKLKSLSSIIPIAFVIFLVTGLIFLGVATPTEAAALGALGVIGLSVAYRKFTFGALLQSLIATVTVSIMIMMIYIGSSAFSQLLAISGSARSLAEWSVALPLPPVVILIAMLLVVMILGCFIDQFSIIMVTVPIFMPIATALHWDPIWFCMTLLVSLTVGTLTPPFGLILFVMKSVVPDATMKEVYKASIPYVLLQIAVIVLIVLFPSLSVWLPKAVGL
jgi:tripartite ATP-independent transporter DctM subunit